MGKIKFGIMLGIIAGIIDVIPMIFQSLTWDSNISAFVFWVVAGFFIATTNIRLKGAIKGISISLLLLLPLAFIIGSQDPIVLLPIIVMNLILGSLLGFFIDKHVN